MMKRVPYLSDRGAAKARDFLLKWIVEAVSHGYKVNHPKLGTFIPAVKRLKPKFKLLKHYNNIPEDYDENIDPRVAAMNLVLEPDFHKELRHAAVEFYRRQSTNS